MDASTSEYSGWPLKIQTACLCLTLMGACGPADPELRFEGPVDPCQVTQAPAARSPGQVAWRAAGLEAAQRGEYWRRGPYPIWATTPSRRCPADPHTGSGTETPDMAMYVTYPAATDPSYTGRAQLAPGPLPVLLFAHANNDSVCQIYRAYTSLHDHWASWGYVVVSVDSTARNCQRGTAQNLRDRARDQRAALQALEQMSADPDSPFFGAIDPTRVILAGHSRGGGASLLNVTSGQVDPQAVLDLQGVDLTAYGFGAPGIEVPTLGVTAGADVDLHHPWVDAAQELLEGPHAWVTIPGATHAWTADAIPPEPDEDPGLERHEQHQITRLFTTAFIAAHAGAADSASGPPFAPDARALELVTSHLGARQVDEHIREGGAIVRWGTGSPEAIWIEDFQAEGTRRNLLGGRTRPVGFAEARRVQAYDLEGEEEGLFWSRARAMLLDTREHPGVLEVGLGEDPIEVPTSWHLQARLKGVAGRRAPDLTVAVTVGPRRPARPGAGRALAGPGAVDGSLHPAGYPAVAALPLARARLGAPARAVRGGRRGGPRRSAADAALTSSPRSAHRPGPGASPAPSSMRSRSDGVCSSMYSTHARLASSSSAPCTPRS